MEYFIGYVFAIITVIIINRVIAKNKYTKYVSVNVVYRQSYVFNLLRPFLPPNINAKKMVNTQSRDFEDKTSTKVIFVSDKAYWIKDNTLYTANVVDGSFVDKDSTTTVDTIGMDKVQLDKMIFIVDRLTEGTQNDYRNSRNS